MTALCGARGGAGSGWLVGWLASIRLVWTFVGVGMEGLTCVVLDLLCPLCACVLSWVEGWACL